MVFWAGNFIVVKGAIGILPPIGFTFLRYCVAAVTLLVLLRWREGAIRLPHGDIIRIGLLGIVGFGCYQILWPVALQSIPAGDSALLIAATPVITAVLAMSIGADTPNPVKLAGALVSFSGVALVVAAGEGLDLRSSIVGDVLTLIAAGVLGGLLGLRRDRPAAAFAAGHDDLGDRGGHPVHRAVRDRPAGDDARSPVSACPSSSRSCTRGRSRRASPTSSSCTA